MKNSNNIVVSLEGWTDIGFSVVSLHLVEEIGGSLAHGILELWLPKEDKPLENITNETHGTLRIIDEKKGGRYYEIPIFIEKRNYLKNTITLEFVCIGDEDFFTRLNFSIKTLNKCINNIIHIVIVNDIFSISNLNW